MKRWLVVLSVLLLPLLALADDAPSATATANLVNGLFVGCWSCGAINALGAIGFAFADKVYQTLASDMTILVGLGFALWLLQFAARLLLPFGPPPAAGHWNAGAVKLFKCAVVLAFLAGSGPFWDYVFTPIFSVGVGLASSLATSSDSYEQGFGGTISGMPNGAVDYCNSTPQLPQNVTLSTAVQPLYNAFTQIDCPLSKMQSEYAKGILVGVSTMGQAICAKSFWSYVTGDRSPAALFLSGLVLVTAFGWGFLVFPVLLIDSIARVILVAATAPIALASILFKPTARIAERSVWSLVNCGFTLIFGAAAAGLGKALIAFVLNSMASQAGAPALNDWSKIAGTLEQSCSADFYVDFSTASFYELLGTAIISTFMMRRAAHLAGELTGVSGNTGIKEAFSSMTGSVGKMMDKTATGIAARAGKGLADLVAGRRE